MTSIRKKGKPNKIRTDRWYIVDTYQLNRPYILWNNFKSEDAAYNIKFRYLKDAPRYSVCSGPNAIRHGLKFYWDLEQLVCRNRYPILYWIRVTKYNYDLANQRIKHGHKMLRAHERERLKKLGKYKPG